MSKRKRKSKVLDGRKRICIRVVPEAAQALALIAENEGRSQGRVVESFLKPFLKGD